MVDSSKCVGICTKEDRDKCWDCIKPEVAKIEETLKCSIGGERCQWKDNQSEQNCKDCAYLMRFPKKPTNSVVCGLHGVGCRWECLGRLEDLDLCKGCNHLITIGKEEVESLDKPFEGLFEEDDSIGYIKTPEDKELLKDPKKAARFNSEKPKWGLVHYESMEPMIRVLEFGAKKYAPFNWMKPMDTREILESIQRHVAALMDGELVDKESGISHMGHIQANTMFYNYHIKK